MNRGDRREAIFRDDEDRRTFCKTLAEACGRTGWQAHAWCLLGNHFHLVVETPRGNLVVGMKWLLGTYTQRFNRRHRVSGHLFQGRYKAQVIDAETLGYLRAACDYVHLNPARAGLVGAAEALESWPWSSYPEDDGGRCCVLSGCGPVGSWANTGSCATTFADGVNWLPGCERREGERMQWRWLSCAVDGVWVRKTLSIDYCRGRVSAPNAGMDG